MAATTALLGPASTHAPQWGTSSCRHPASSPVTDSLPIFYLADLRRIPKRNRTVQPDDG
jgi:hypothetical protein